MVTHGYRQQGPSYRWSGRQRGEPLDNESRIVEYSFLNQAHDPDFDLLINWNHLQAFNSLPPMFEKCAPLHNVNNAMNIMNYGRLDRNLTNNRT